MIKISVLNDFTMAPWARYYEDWDYSWEEFYEEHLKSKYLEAIEKKVKIQIDLDGTIWYPSSFLSEVFWRLYTENWKESIWDNIEIITEDNPLLLDIIYKYAKEYKWKKISKDNK